MTDALAALRTEAQTQETGPLPRVSDAPEAPAGPKPAPGRYLATEDGGALVLFALGAAKVPALEIFDNLKRLFSKGVDGLHG